SGRPGAGRARTGGGAGGRRGEPLAAGRSVLPLNAVGDGVAGGPLARRPRLGGKLGAVVPAAPGLPVRRSLVLPAALRLPVGAVAVAVRPAAEPGRPGLGDLLADPLDDPPGGQPVRQLARRRDRAGAGRAV